MLSVSTQIAKEDSLVLFEKMIKSVSFADEIVVHNLGREDQGFLTLAKLYNLVIINSRASKVIEEIRKKEVLTTRYDWVLIMDFDEIITNKLQQEIKILINQNPSTYKIRRRNFSLGYELKRGGFGDDYVPRLFHKSLFIGWPKDIHSLPIVTGNIKKTTNYMEHYKDASLKQMVSKTNRYSDVESAQYLAGNMPEVTMITLLRKWFMESFRRGILKGGLLDGEIGIIQSIYQGFSVFISYAKLYERQCNEKSSHR